MELRQIETTNHNVVLELSGNFDADGSQAALPHIDQLISNDKYQDVELDLKGVSFVDSSGVGAIVYLYKRLVEKQRNMHLENVRGQPLEIFELLRINKAIPVNAKA